MIKQKQRQADKNTFLSSWNLSIFFKASAHVSHLIISLKTHCTLSIFYSFICFKPSYCLFSRVFSPHPPTPPSPVQQWMIEMPGSDCKPCSPPSPLSLCSLLSPKASSPTLRPALASFWSPIMHCDGCVSSQPDLRGTISKQQAKINSQGTVSPVGASLLFAALIISSSLTIPFCTSLSLFCNLYSSVLTFAFLWFINHPFLCSFCFFSHSRPQAEVL